jgi:hypothetical protein
VHSWREGTSIKGRALTLVGFILLRGGTLHGRWRVLGKGETITLLSFARGGGVLEERGTPSLVGGIL